MTIGERIRKIRKENGLTLDKFGDKIGLKQGVVSMMENGKSKVTDQTIRSICREFNISEAWLRDESGSMCLPQDTFNLDEFLRERGATEMEKQIIRAYYLLPEKTRQEIREMLSAQLVGLFRVVPEPDPSIPQEEIVAEVLHRVNDMGE